MLRRVAIFPAILLWGSALLPAGIFTDDLGTMKRTSLAPLPPDKPALWAEYGLISAENARYEGRGVAFDASAWRLKDPTGSQAAFRWLRPANARPAPQQFAQYTAFSAVQGDTLWMTHGNYLLRLKGAWPNLDELKILLFQMPNLDQSSLPPVLEYFPQADVVDGSDRFINGPSSLEAFFGKVPPSTAGFHFGAEAVAASYKTASGPMEMAVFYYPTNAMARDRQPEFEKLPGALVKRTGPLLAVILAPKNADDAQRLLAKVNYRANLTIHQAVNHKEPNVGDLLIGIFTLVGLLLALCIVAGAMMYGGRLLRRRMAGGLEEEPMTTLHLDDRR